MSSSQPWNIIKTATAYDVGSPGHGWGQTQIGVGLIPVWKSCKD